MRGRRIWSYIVHLLIVGALSLADERLSFLYAVTLLLVLLDRVDRQRALTRMFQIANEARLTALLKSLGIADPRLEDVLDAMHQEGRLPPEVWNQLVSDYHLAATPGLSRSEHPSLFPGGAQPS
jgi:hypothetical protein